VNEQGEADENADSIGSIVSVPLNPTNKEESKKYSHRTVQMKKFLNQGPPDVICCHEKDKKK
jgi:hypothetical protein